MRILFIGDIVGKPGRELIRRGLRPGPVVAQTLKQIEARWVAEGFPNNERLAELVDETLAPR